VNRLEPVSFVYNQGDGRVRYGFIAEDTAAIDAHLATYDASGAVSGIDDRSILAVVIGAIKDLWSKVLALIESDKAQNARIKQLEDEVAALKAQSAAAGAGSIGGGTTPASLPASGDADTSSTTPGTDSSKADSAAGAPEQGGAEAPAVSAQEEDVVHDDGVEDESGTIPTSQTSPQPDASSPPSTDAANDHAVPEPLPAAGTE
jgi:hypothetical protein